MTTAPHAASARINDMLRGRRTFQISVDVGTLPLGLSIAAAALKAGITLVEMGTPVMKMVGVTAAVPAFRERFPEALLLADMKTMDGGGYEARGVYEGGGNIIDFLALAGMPSARAACATRDEFRARDESLARLAFADILLPQQAHDAVEVAQRMLDAGVDGVGVHLQHDARQADPSLLHSAYLSDIAEAVFEAVGDRGSVQVVGGLSIEQAVGLARRGLKAFVISGNLGLPDAESRYTLPPAEITRHVGDFISAVSAA